jgi:hypothetical protein
VIVKIPVHPISLSEELVIRHEPCCGSESDDPTTLGDLSSALSELEGGEGRGEVRSLWVSDSEAGAVEVSAAAVVDDHG